MTDTQQQQELWQMAPSLRPDFRTVWGCILHNPEDEAIRDAYRFKYNVTILSEDQYEALVQRATTLFRG